MLLKTSSVAINFRKETLLLSSLELKFLANITSKRKVEFSFFLFEKWQKCP